MQPFFLVKEDRAIAILRVMDAWLLEVAVEIDFLTLLDDTNELVASTDACQTCVRAILEVGEVKQDGGIDVVAYGTHREGVAGIDEVVGLEGVERQCARMLGERPGRVVGIVVPLPERAESFGLETDVLVGEVGSVVDRLVLDGHRPRVDGFADTIAIVIDTDDRPVVLPRHGLQMHDATDGSCVLEVIEPPRVVGRIDNGALVRTIDGGRARFEHTSAFVGTIDILRAEHGLPATFDATFGNGDVIVSVALHELRAFGHGAFIDRNAFIEQLLAVATHLVDDDGACTMSAADEISLAGDDTGAIGFVDNLIVPEWTGIFPFGYLPDEMEGLPRSCRFWSRGHEETFVGCAEIDVESTILITQRRCPGAACIMLVGVPARIVETVIDLRHDTPVHHVV